MTCGKRRKKPENFPDQRVVFKAIPGWPPGRTGPPRRRAPARPTIGPRRAIPPPRPTPPPRRTPPPTPPRVASGAGVPRGALVQVCARMATRATPTYEALCAQVRGSPVVSPDETGWKVAGTLHWLWAFATADPTVYAIRPGRGFVDAATILGKDFAGVLARDGWAPYRRFGHADHQTCGAHLLRRCRLLQLDHPRSPVAARVQQRLQQALALRDRYAAGDISPHGLASARGRLLTQTLDLLTTTRSTIPAVQRFAAHLTVEASALFTFLGDPAIDATNWRAEHALRPAVVMRKVCGGNRSVRGAQTQQVLTSVLRTTHQRGLDPARLLATILRAPTPSVPPSLQAPPP